MTVPDNDRLKQTTATGGETTLVYDFTLAAKTHLVVTEEDVAGVVATLVVDVDYTVNGVGQIGGSTITLDTTLYPSGATAAHIFTLSGNTPAERLADFALRGDLSSVQLNSEQDAVINIVQQIQRDVDRAYSLPLSDGENVVTTVPSIALRASQFWAWDAQGDLVAAAGTSGNLGPVTAYMDTLLDDVDAAAAQATLELGKFESAAQAIVTDVTRTLPHGLGARPGIVQLWIECNTAEHGYSIGDRVFLIGDNVRGTTSSVTLWADATNVYLIEENNTPNIFILHKTTRASTGITEANWDYIVTARE